MYNLDHARVPKYIETQCSTSYDLPSPATPTHTSFYPTLHRSPHVTTDHCCSPYLTDVDSAWVTRYFHLHMNVLKVYCCGLKTVKLYIFSSKAVAIMWRWLRRSRGELVSWFPAADQVYCSCPTPGLRSPQYTRHCSTLSIVFIPFIPFKP